MNEWDEIFRFEGENEGERVWMVSACSLCPYRCASGAVALSGRNGGSGAGASCVHYRTRATSASATEQLRR
jgi:hypothetical protein